MSVESTAYLVYGIKLPYIKDLYEHEKLLPYIEGHEGIEYSIINDGMCCKYTVFGKVFAQIDEYDDEDVYLDDLILDEKEWLDTFYEVFDGIIEYANVKPKLFIFMNYS